VVVSSADGEPPSGGSGAGRGRVLVVEDDPRTLQFVTLALARAGFDVESAVDAVGALARLREGGIDVLLADIGLPGMSGFELIEEARRLVPDLAIALMTADASVDVAVNALRNDVDDFLPKPISPTALVSRVERLVERRRTKTRHLPERVLAVGAHPDDVEIGVGGILLGHHQAEDHITILTLSHGARGGDALIRAAEAAAAAALLGAELILGDLEDTRIPESDPTVGLIEAAIEQVRPSIVYTHTLCDLHQDHRNVNRATMVAARRVPNVYCYESPSATVSFGPVRFVGIDSYVDTKLAAINAYGSQTEVRSYLDEDLIRATARYWGRFGQSRYCEPLEVIRDRPSVRVEARRD
jgi:two-component system, NtrC family, response regulator HydG